MLEILYHVFVLHTITYDMGMWDVIRLVIGCVVTAGAVAIARYRINRRLEARSRYENVAALTGDSKPAERGFPIQCVS